jgi:hypothetical protein
VAAKDWVEKWFDKEDAKESPERTSLAAILRDEVKTEEDAALFKEFLKRVKEGK